MIEKPLIYTTLGHLAIEGLRHHVEWVQSPEQIIFIESYFQGDELVKKSSHVCVLTGAASIGEANI